MAVDSGGNWLSASPLAGTAPSTLTVTVSTAGLAEGTYTGTVTVTALSGTNASNSPQALTVSLTVGVPVIGENGVVNGASFSEEAVVSPSSIASLFGSNLATTTAVATGLPLPTILGGTQVLVNGVPAGLYIVSPLQIYFQIPPGVSGTTMEVVVVSNGVIGPAATVNVAPEVPSIFSLTGSGAGQGAVLNQDGTFNSHGNPAAPGSVIQIFATGLGATNPPVEAGQPGATEPPFNLTTVTPVVLIGGLPAEVSFSAVAPGFVGLYRVDAAVPVGTPAGNAIELQIQIGGQNSNIATIAVQ